MKVLLLADFHGIRREDWNKLMKIDKNLFDLIILLGDIDGIYIKPIVETFVDKKTIGVHGNHDIKNKLEGFGVEDIHNKIISIEGLSILGLEGSVRYKRSENNPLYTQFEMINICDKLDYADIVISHNSPFNIHDADDVAHRGFQGLLSYIEKHSPKYCMHGHQHVDISTKHLETEVIGVYGASIFNTKNGNIKKIF